MPVLERIHFEIPRVAEYFSANELAIMTGQPPERFASVALKELADNGVDGVEKVQGDSRRAPELTLEAEVSGPLLRLSVTDNGCGIGPETVQKILNFQTRTSDKVAYRAPTRGAQGNALKTVLGMPWALGSREPVVIESQGVRHSIRLWIDPAGELGKEHLTGDSPLIHGTRVSLALPAWQGDELDLASWGMGFSLFNPHVLVKIQGSGLGGEHAHGPRGEIRDSYQPTVEFPRGWRKFLPNDLTSPWWYDEEDFTRLVYAHLAACRQGGKDLTLREFVRTFRGLSGTGPAKQVCDGFPDVSRLKDLEGQNGDIARLLQAMQRQTKHPPSPNVLGLVGEDHFRERFRAWFGIRPGRFWYKSKPGLIGGLPFVVEVAVAHTDRPGRLFHGVNFSPTFSDPIAGTRLDAGEAFTAYGLSGFLGHAHARPGADRVAVAVHLVCPALQFLDRAKTRLQLSPEMAVAVGEALWKATRVLYAEGERRCRDAARQEKAEENQLRKRTGKEHPLTLAVPNVLPEAIRHATGDGKYPVSAHTLFYAVRPLVQKFGCRQLTSDYFEQTLLPAYQQKHGPIVGLYYEPRGTLYEPHTGREVPLGTREVGAYKFPSWLYDKILFIEKQGLWPVFKAARLGERYDMAIIAGEGYATEACRVLLANAEKSRDYQLFVFRDADPYGYNIARTLREETSRMPGYNVNVIDLGLKLQAALDLGLPAEKFTRKQALPAGLELTELERKYFEGRQVGKKSWVCQRVELNAFSGPGLVAYTEQGLQAAGVRGKVVPPDEHLPFLAEGVYRMQIGNAAEDTLHELLSVEELRSDLADQFRGQLPLTKAREWIEEAHKDNSETHWRDAISAKVWGWANESLGKIKDTLRDLISRKITNQQ
jgi:DNA topoisomerase VI subunit B